MLPANHNREFINVNDVTTTEIDTDKKDEKSANELMGESNVSVSADIANVSIISNSVIDTTTSTDITPTESLSEITYHADESINNAVKAMRNMGFSNEHSSLHHSKELKFLNFYFCTFCNWHALFLYIQNWHALFL
uniref:Uncharacterized protein n=1 Tax=Glossina morsitans morsitans TaxID=37546 RepID=A0A1B0FNH5_GLOMM